MKETLNGVVDIHFVSHGRWKIDEESGKTLCRIEVKVPQKGITFNFIPSHDFCEKFIDKMLEAEFENDTYEYKEPKIAPTRPSQLVQKTERLLKVLQKWQVRGETLSEGHPHSIQHEVHTPPKPMGKCWNCQKNAMKEAPELGKGWRKCQECGATEVK